jgi:DNA-binding NtrC family response regulator
VSDATVSTHQGSTFALEVQKYRARVVNGVDKDAVASAVDGRLTVGTAEGATLRLKDPTVSRFHLETEWTEAGLVIRDLGSTNGTMLGPTGVREITARDAIELDLGRTRVRIEMEMGRVRRESTTARSFGALIGGSAPMRAIYSVLERAAPTTVPVLITGESGTGKELAARAVHAASPRASKPFEVVDCGGLPPTLVESELFGHERGAFTGAVSEREGAFERADGGTLFLDELGELPLEVQPKLLRVLGEGEVRRVGGKKTKKVDVRVVAATNRDLRREINVGQFRGDLYYRLAVIQVRMPALRERLDDLPSLVMALFERIRKDRGVQAEIDLDEDFWTPLATYAWPGNVRELRNYLEQLLILRVAPPLEGASDVAERAPGALLEGLDQLPWHNAKSELIERFERQYISTLLAQTHGNIAEAARRAGVDRGTLFRTIRRLGLKRGENDET